MRYRSQGLIRHLLHSNDAFAQDVASGQVATVKGAITKKLVQPYYSSGEGGSVPPSFEIYVASREPDGTLSATMGAGAAQSGRWSLDSAGRVVTNVMGTPLAIDASVASDELTLVINGQALLLRRRR